ncbi:MAG: RNA polymerase sigma factor [Candidatus Zixiibacteriota bacterium]
MYITGMESDKEKINIYGRSVAPDDDEREVRELVREIKSGNEQAFAELTRRYRSQVAAIAYKLVNDYDEAGDITQIVLVKMASNIWRYDEKRKFYTWLYRIVVNASIDYMRKHRRHRHEPLEEYHDSVDAVTPTPEQAYRSAQISEYISEAAKTLSEKQRSAFVLRDVEGCKINDVASMMQMPEATVRWYLHRARTAIRKELTRRCPQLLLLLGIK